ncbi:MAG: glycoside hydrolase family 88 protein [Ruminococcus sp.]|nr:glycoside hydrolase family 88 protein [Ruminococcus sp.]
METADKIAQSYINNLILPSEPLSPMWNRENFIFRKTAKWNYIDNCIINSVIKLYELTGNNSLLDYAVKFTDAYIEDGSIPTMRTEDFNLDNINGGRNLIWIFSRTGDGRYRKAIDRIYSQIEKQPRLENGSFWHKAIYPHQIWLDGIYMALPFMAEYAELSGNSALYDDIYSQLENVRRLMRDSETGLYFHGYDETRSQCWADRITGLSSEFWLRSIGWLSSGLADLCGTLPRSRLYILCSEMLLELLESLSVCSNPDGTLCQLPAKPHVVGNYTETSGTLLFAYSAVKSANLGISGQNILNAGLTAFSSVTEKYIIPESIPVLKNICLMAGLGGADNRDGSEKYYLSEKVVSNDAKGIAPYLMAYAEIRKRQS